LSHNVFLKVGKLFTDLFYFIRDTPACGAFHFELSTGISTFRGKNCGKRVGNAAGTGGQKVDYPPKNVDNFSTDFSLWTSAMFVHMLFRSYPQNAIIDDPLWNMGYKRLSTLSTGLIITDVGFLLS